MVYKNIPRLPSTNSTEEGQEERDAKEEGDVKNEEEKEENREIYGTVQLNHKNLIVKNRQNSNSLKHLSDSDIISKARRLFPS